MVGATCSGQPGTTQGCFFEEQIDILSRDGPLCSVIPLPV